MAVKSHTHPDLLCPECLLALLALLKLGLVGRPDLLLECVLFIFQVHRIQSSVWSSSCPLPTVRHSCCRSPETSPSRLVGSSSLPLLFQRPPQTPDRQTCLVLANHCGTITQEMRERRHVPKTWRGVLLADEVWLGNGGHCGVAQQCPDMSARVLRE